MRVLEEVAAWPVDHVAVALVTGSGVELRADEPDREFRWASVTKLLTALSLLVALEEGIVELDAPAGPPGSTVRHLAAHASGLAPDGDSTIARPGERRIYSNTGFQALARAVEAAAEMPFAEYLRAAVIGPLGLSRDLHGSPAAGYRGTIRDLIALAAELLGPRVVAPETLREATTVQFPGLVGVLPGFGRQEPNDWGLGFELRDAKQPHWTGRLNSSAAFGHFGASGTFLWVDPERGAALACLTDREFGDWAVDAWPRLADAVLTDL